MERWLRSVTPPALIDTAAFVLAMIGFSQFGWRGVLVIVGVYLLTGIAFLYVYVQRPNRGKNWWGWGSTIGFSWAWGFFLVVHLHDGPITEDEDSTCTA